MSNLTAVYVSATQGVHDHRWIEALRECVDSVRAITAGQHASSPADLCRTVTEIAPDVVVAGPLDPVARPLIGIGVPVIGLSWGYDLFALAEQGDVLWLTGLGGLLVDTDAGANIARSAGLNATQITVLPWGVDLSLCTPEGERATLPVPADAWVVLCARAHEPLYRVRDVIEAFIGFARTTPQAHLVLANEGSLTSDLQDLSAQSDCADRIHFIGRIDEREVPALLRASDCYVTLSEVDGTSVTLLQAMACSVPVIASGIAGNREWVIDGQTGTTVEVGDIAAVSRALTDHFSSPRAQQLEHARTQVAMRADWTTNRVRLCQAIDAALRN